MFSEDFSLQGVSLKKSFCTKPSLENRFFLSLDLLRQGKVGANLILLPVCVFISSALLRSMCGVFWAQPWCETQTKSCQPLEPRRAGAGLSLQRGCTSILGEAAAKPGAITTHLEGLKTPPSQQRHPKPLLRETLCRAL